jgi:acetyl/propionyl-CoA carboxylase alpha subunit
VPARSSFFFSDKTREFYFLEMNTRLQVEHPVTELVTGFDLVREQVNVAAGGKLSFAQGDVCWHGHAIECRVYAEDPENNFSAVAGRISFLRVPAGREFVMTSGVTEGDEVSIYYDPMISKLAAWAGRELRRSTECGALWKNTQSAESRPLCLSFAKSFATKSSVPGIWIPDLFRVSTSAVVSAQAVRRLPACIRTWP